MQCMGCSSECMSRSEVGPCQEVGGGPLMELSVVDNGVVQKPKTGRDKVGNDHINLKKEVKDCGSKLGLVSLCSAPGPQAVQPHQHRHKATKPNAKARAS